MTAPAPLNHTSMENRVLHIVGIRKYLLRDGVGVGRCDQFMGQEQAGTEVGGAPSQKAFSVHLMTLSFYPDCISEYCENQTQQFSRSEHPHYLTDRGAMDGT